MKTVVGVQTSSSNYGIQPFEKLLSQSSTGTWILSLPPSLQEYQDELELLLAKAFSGRPRCPENLELAQQLVLNWCISKCRKHKIHFEECLQKL